MVNKKSEEEGDKKKNRFLKFRPIGDDEEIIRGKAAEADLSVSEYMRQMCRNGKVTVRHTAAVSVFDSGMVYQINKIGVNLHQFLKKYHATGHPPPSNLERVLHKLDLVLDAILDVLSQFKDDPQSRKAG